MKQIVNLNYKLSDDLSQKLTLKFDKTKLAELAGAYLYIGTIEFFTEVLETIKSQLTEQEFNEFIKYVNDTRKIISRQKEKHVVNPFKVLKSYFSGYE